MTTRRSSILLTLTVLAACTLDAEPLGPGETGPVGETGPLGPTGPQGPSGTSAWEADADRVTTNRDVGIGTTAPQAELDVAGTVNVSDGITGSGVGVLTYEDITIDQGDYVLVNGYTGYRISSPSWLSIQHEMEPLTRIIAINMNNECQANSIVVAGRFFIKRNGNNGHIYLVDGGDWQDLDLTCSPSWRAWYVNM